MMINQNYLVPLPISCLAHGLCPQHFNLKKKIEKESAFGIFFPHSLFSLVSFSGCNGNNNRFATMQACENACRHVSKLRKTEIVCNLPISEGSCDEILLQTNSTIPKWTYDNRRRRCVPFYFTGCGGNENIFDTKSDCEDICPTTFPPIIRLPGGSEVLAKRGL